MQNFVLIYTLRREKGRQDSLKKQSVFAESFGVMGFELHVL